MAKISDPKPSSRKGRPKRIRKMRSSDYGGMSQEGFVNFMNMVKSLGATDSQVDSFAAAYLEEVAKYPENFEITMNERLMSMYKKITKI